MTIETSAGATLAVSATPTATNDAAGFGALTYTQVGEVEAIGTIGGTFDEITFVPIDTAIETVVKGVYRQTALTLGLGRDLADAGQAILSDAATPGDATVNTELAFKLTLASGSIIYISALCMSYTADVPDANSVVRSSASIRPTDTPVFA